MRMRGVVVFILWFSCIGAVAQQSTCEPCRSVTVMVFFGLECPISQKYVPRLNQLVTDYPDFKWEFIVPAGVKKKDLQAFVKEYETKFTLTADPGMVRTMKYKVTITPEIVVAGEAEEILYQGAIDNWFYELGKYRQFITEHYLTDALKAILQGQDIAVTRTEAIGCLIQMPEQHHH